MGRELWFHHLPWAERPADGLAAFQAGFFRERYDFDALLAEQAVAIRDALKVERETGDRFGLVATWERAVKLVDDVLRRPPAKDDVAGQIEAMRRIIAVQTPDGFGNVLDVKGVSDEGGHEVARLLSAIEVAELAGTPRPTPAQAEGAVRTISRGLGRSESVCFETFDATSAKASAWFIVGYTHD